MRTLMMSRTRGVAVHVAGWLVALLMAALPVAAVAADSPLADAAMERDIEAVRALLGEGADVNAGQGDGMTALHWAAFRDDREIARLLIEAEADVDAWTRVGDITPLRLASKNGSAAMIALLVEAEADVNRGGTTGTTPLMAAAMTGSPEAVQVLLDHGAYVDARDVKNGQTPLMFAAWENRADAIALLVGYGAHMGLTSFVTSLIEESRKYDDDGNPLPNRTTKASRRGGNSVMGGMTALLFAARDGNLEAVRALVEAGADVDQVSGGDGSSPMVIAASNGHFTVTQYLLDQGADPNLANTDGLAPLNATVHMRYAPVSWAPNPIFDQEVVGPLELIQALLDRGADPNQRLRRKLWFSPSSHDRSWVEHVGATPFWRAAMSSDVEAMRLLVAAGADPNLSTDSDTTPLMVAAGIGWTGNLSQNAPDSFRAAVEYCVELGNDINAIDADGFTALHGAASRGESEVVRYLVEHGARVDVISDDGDSAADMAFGPWRFIIPNPETADVLVELGSPFQNNCRSDQCVDGKFNSALVPK